MGMATKFEEKAEDTYQIFKPIKKNWKEKLQTNINFVLRK